MNWFKQLTPPSLKPDNAQCCPHCDADWSKAAFGTSECDSFGCDDPYWYCQECKAHHQDATSPDPCVDCGKFVANHNITDWKWHNFCFRQGDTPIHVCVTCQVLPKHQGRLLQDKADSAVEDNELAEDDQGDKEAWDSTDFDEDPNAISESAGEFPLEVEDNDDYEHESNHDAD